MREALPIAQSSPSLPANSYIYTVTPAGSNLSAICSDDSLRVFDPLTLQSISDRTVSHVHEGMTCLAEHGESSCLFTAGRDGLVKAWDHRSGQRALELELGIVNTHCSYSDLRYKC